MSHLVPAPTSSAPLTSTDGRAVEVEVVQRQAGAAFLGVTYGWGITRNENPFPTVDSPEAIGDYVLKA